MTLRTSVPRSKAWNLQRSEKAKLRSRLLSQCSRPDGVGQQWNPPVSPVALSISRDVLGTFNISNEEAFRQDTHRVSVLKSYNFVYWMYRRWHPWERPPREPASKRHTPNCKSNRAWDQRDPRWSGRHKCVTVIRGSIRSSYIRYTKVAGYNNLPFLSMDHIPFETNGSCIWIGAMDRQGIWEWGLFYKPIPKKTCVAWKGTSTISCIYIYVCTYWSYYYILLLSFWSSLSLLLLLLYIYCSAFLPDSLYMSIQVQVHETVDKRKHWPFFHLFGTDTVSLHGFCCFLHWV